MGYKKGDGLGKSGMGVTEALDVKLRPKNAGVGAAGEEQTEVTKRLNKRIKQFHKAEGHTGEDAASESESEDESSDGEPHTKKPKEDRSVRWRKGATKKPKTVYKTAEEVAKEGLAAPQKQKIIDMRGPQTRTIVDLEGLSGGIPTGFEAEGRSSSLPELQHNLNCLLDEAELDIQEAERKEHRLKDHLARGQKELNELRTKVDTEGCQIESVLSVLKLLTEAQQQAESNKLTLEEVEQLFEKLRTNHSQEFRLFRLSRIAVAIVFPLVETALQGWKPLQEPKKIAKVLMPWKRLLRSTDDAEEQVLGSGKLSTRIQFVLLDKVVLPAIRTPLVNEWNPRDTEPALQLFEGLQRVLDPSIFTMPVQQLLVPKLKREVDKWNPKQDRVPIDKWLQPWILIVGLDSISPFFPAIRHKLASALEAWQLFDFEKGEKDASAKAILAPWQKVWEEESWKAFMNRHILPKLAATLGMAQVDPADQKRHLVPFRAVMSWVTLIEEAAFVQLLCEGFFPKWHAALHRWMTSTPNFDEVQKWYHGWKQELEPVMTNGQVKQQFTRALDLMNAAVAGQDLSEHRPGLKENLTHLRKEQQRSFEKEAPKKNVEMTFKEVVEDIAAEHDFVLMPTKAQHDSGKAIYTFGKVKVYLDNSVVFWLNGEDWAPIGLDDLVELAKVKQPGK